MKQYHEAIERIYLDGVDTTDRTGVGTRSLFGMQMRFDLSEGFPAVTTKKLAFRSMAAELLWFLSGSTNVHDLQAMGCTIWDEWAREDGQLGPIYGKQWRRWDGKPVSAEPTLTHMDDEGIFHGNVTITCAEIDQIAQLIEGLRKNPSSRRHIVSAWNPADIPDMALPPCHALFQFHVTPGVVPRLSCQLYQRSADFFLGVPFNIASYSLLTHMVAQQCDMEPDAFIWTGGDCHIYANHMEQVTELLSRSPRQLPRLVIKRRPASIFDYQVDNFELDGYDPYPAIKALVAV